MRIDEELIGRPDRHFRPIIIAVADPTLRLIIWEAMRRLLKNPRLVFTDGRRAHDYVLGVGPYGNRASHPPPALVIVSATFPGMSGLDLLAAVRKAAFVQRPYFILIARLSPNHLFETGGCACISPDDRITLMRLLETYADLVRWIADFDL